MWAKLLLLGSFAASVWAQEDPKDLLLKVRAKVTQTVNRLPRYLCTQTIDRSIFLPEPRLVSFACDDLASRQRNRNRKLPIHSSDRLRLDVAISDHNEMYSWVGEGRFQDRSLSDIVRRGAISTGAFSSLLASIFTTDVASFSYDGDSTVDGRTLVEFGFRVPAEKSEYTFGNRVHDVITGYKGTFDVDPSTYDLVRLIAETDQLPPEVDACEATTTLDYQNVRLNGVRFLLPQEAQLSILGRNGAESRNRTVFSGCHEFEGESTLVFDLQPESGAAAGEKIQARAFVLAAGLPFTIALTQSIDTATAAAGDVIRAKLTTNIRDKSGVIVSKGAAVTGRVAQIERLYGPSSQSLLLAVRLETVDKDGRPQPFTARLTSSIQPFARQSAGLRVREDLGSFDQMEDPGLGFIQFQNVNERYLIHSGLELSGQTFSR